MFKIFKKRQEKDEEIEIKIDGMHCTSCALNIDDLLEETEGIFSSNTSYAKSKTKIEYNSEKINTKKILQLIKEVGYEGSVV